MNIPANSVLSINFRIRGNGRQGYAMTTLKYYNVAVIPDLTQQMIGQISQQANIVAFVNQIRQLVYNDQTCGVHSIQFTGPTRRRVYYDGGSAGPFPQQVGNLGAREMDEGNSMTQSRSLNLIKTTDAAGRRGVGHNYIPCDSRDAVINDRINITQPLLVTFLNAVRTFMTNDVQIDGALFRPCVVGLGVAATGANNLKSIRFAEYGTFMDTRRVGRGA